MNGAEALIRTAVGAGVDVCFANPGTTEMPLVAALDSVPGMRAVLVAVRGRLHRRRRWLRADVRQACDDAAASRPRSRQRPRQSAQRAPRKHSDRQCDWRSGDVASRGRRAADQRYRVARLADVGMGAREQVRGRRRRATWPTRSPARSRPPAT